MPFHRARIVALFCLALTVAAACDRKEIPEKKGSGRDRTGVPAAPGTADGDGLRFASDTGRFRIVLPPGFPEPAESITPLPLPDGTSVELRQYTSVLGNNAVIVGFNTMNGLVVKGIEKQLLDNAREGTLKRMHATLEKEEEISLDGHPGRRLFILPSPASDTTLKARKQVYVTDSMVYQLYYISTSRKALESPSADAFFDSFTLTGR